jgi:hypothetical protein
MTNRKSKVACISHLHAIEDISAKRIRADREQESETGSGFLIRGFLVF